MEEATRAYAARRPEFNLLSNNCARFACSMLALCGGAEAASSEAVSLLSNSSAAVAAPPTCHPDVCADHLMFEGPKGEPGCGMHAVSTNLAGHMAGHTQVLSAVPASVLPAAQPVARPAAPVAQQGGLGVLLPLGFM